MEEEHKPVIVAEDSPDRCHGLTQKAQCRFQKVPGTNYCRVHGGRGSSGQAKQKLNMYRLERWENRVSELTMSPDAKSLKEEVAILRMLLEEKLNMCKSNTDLVIYAPSIGDLVVKIANVVKLLHNIDISLGNTLDKTVLHQFAAEIVAIISRNVPDEEIVGRIAIEFEETLERLGDLVAGDKGKNQVY